MACLSTKRIFFQPFAVLILTMSLLGPAHQTRGQSDSLARQANIDNAFDRVFRLRSSGEYEHALGILDSLLFSAKGDGDLKTVSRTLLDQAFIHNLLNNLSLTLSLLQEAEAVNKGIGNQPGTADVHMHKGAIYQTLDDYDKAFEEYTSAMTIYREMNLKKEMGMCFNNFGSLFEDQGDPYGALGYHNASLKIWKEIEEMGWQGISYIHIGTCYDLLNKPDSAIHYLQTSAQLLREHRGKRQLAVVYNLLGTAYIHSGNYRQAKNYCEQSMDISRELGLVKYEYKSCECLSDVHAHFNQMDKALDYHKLFVSLKDSVFDEQKAKEITQLEMSYAFQQQQTADSLTRVQEQLEKDLQFQEELSKERESRNMAMFAGLLVLVLAGAMFSRLRFVRRSRAVIARERDRSDKLLLNILPEQIAQELKDHGQAEAREYDSVSILFTDFSGFTRVSEQLSATELVSELNVHFEAFDEICGHYQLEKIKTIGDSYMVAGGLPDPTAEAVRNTVLAGLEMQGFVVKRIAEQKGKGIPAFEMRAGIHTGPVVAGIVGSRKFQYDVWGDTVNTASRMESSGEVGKLNISQTTYNLIKDDPEFSFEMRGMIKAKGKGEMEMYFVRKVDK